MFRAREFSLFFFYAASAIPTNHLNYGLNPNDVLLSYPPGVLVSFMFGLFFFSPPL